MDIQLTLILLWLRSEATDVEDGINQALSPLPSDPAGGGILPAMRLHTNHGQGPATKQDDGYFERRLGDTSKRLGRLCGCHN